MNTAQSVFAASILLIVSVCLVEGKEYPPITDEELEKAANMTDPIIRNETVWDNEMDHDPHDGAEDRHYRIRISRWQNGILPYVITGSFTSAERTNIARAMNNIMNNVPCVRIVPRNGQSDYVDITNNDDGCFAYNGNTGGRHQLNLNRSGGCSGDVSTIIHEFLHSLGAMHEHKRPDRDQFVRIIWSDIDPRFRYAFWRSSWEGQTSSSTRCSFNGGPNFDNCVNGEELRRHNDLPYDLDSIMHYSRGGFSTTGGPTIVARNGRTDFGRSATMTSLDIRKLRRAYGCDAATTTQTTTTTTRPTTTFCSELQLQMVTNSHIDSILSFYKGTYQRTSEVTYDGGRAFPVYRKVSDSRVYLAHDDSSTTYYTPWLFYYNSRPGTATGHIGLGWSNLINPTDERAVQYYDYNSGQWFYTSQASAVCVRNRDLETEAELTMYDGNDDDNGGDPEIPDGGTPEGDLAADTN